MLEKAICPDDPAKARAIIHRLANVPREFLEWLWPGRIPLGNLTLLCGDPGLGKSFVTLDLASRVSRGRAERRRNTERTRHRSALRPGREPVPRDRRPRPGRLPKATKAEIQADAEKMVEHVSSQVVIVNRDATPLDGMADLVIRRPIGEVIGSIVVAMEPDVRPA